MPGQLADQPLPLRSERGPIAVGMRFRDESAMAGRGNRADAAPTSPPQYNGEPIVIVN
jgi:hypothetical protein